jgi:ribosomal protein S18 acetylase RimI-like enzyme
MSSLESDLRIELIKGENSPYVQEINRLGDANVKTFAFRKHSFYKKYANNPGILVAFVNNDLAGYLIWSINKKKRLTRLWQLCVKNEYQGQKIAKYLHQEFVKLASQGSREIRLECKDNYGIDGMWQSLGYSSIFEKQAKMQGDTLKTWSMQFISHEPSIFSYISSELSNLNCSIDAYTLQDFIENDDQKDSIKWLSSYLGVCVTDEFFNEIDKFEHRNREKLRNLIIIGQIAKQLCDPFKFEQSCQIVKDVLDQNSIELDETSIRHLARCLAAEIPYFITKKSDVLRLSSFLLDTGVQIISLEEAIDLRENDTDITEYQPARLANKTVQLKDLNQFSLEEIGGAIHRLYANSDREKLFKDLQNYRNTKKDFCNYILTYENEPHILIVYNISQKEQLETPLLRVIKETNLTTTLLNFVVNELLEVATEKNCPFLKITDPHLREPEKIILARQYFTENQQGFEWVKSCYRDTLNSHEVVKYLDQASKDHPEYSRAARFLSSWLNSQEVLNDSLYCMDIERLLWPLKIENSHIPNFIIPIKPEYAKELFDKNLAMETLFGIQRTDLFLGLDRVYYKSPRSNAGLKKAPARILWYVSKSKDSGHSSLSAIRACSQIDDVIIDTPEEVYKKFQHLGYYNLKQIQSCSNSDQVMAIKFSHTELFTNPIDQTIIKQCLESSAPMQSMRQISQEEFITLYRLGFNLKIK